MTTRHELLSHWQQRLTESEHLVGEVKWSDRLRKRLYRFLLAMYGRSVWPGSKDDVDNSQGRALHSALHVAESQAADLLEGTAGKAPRSRARILAGLKHVQGLSEELAPPGPLQEGLGPDSLVVAFSTTKKRRAAMVFRHLKRGNLRPRLVRQGKSSQIFVSWAMASQANELLASPDFVAKLNSDRGSGWISIETARKINYRGFIAFASVTVALTSTMIWLKFTAAFFRVPVDPLHMIYLGSVALVFGMLTLWFWPSAVSKA